MIVDRHKLSGKQLKNIEEALKAYRERSVISSTHPAVLFIELTRNCISRCLYCRKKWNNDPRYNMSRETFDVVLSDLAPFAGFIDLRSYGESLMLHDFKWYLEKLASVCPNLRITTTLGCGDENTLKALIDYNVFISVSFDAADKKVYERYRRGIHYETVLRNLKFVSSEMLKKHGDLHGRMRIGIAPLYRDNLDYVIGVIQLAHELHIPEIRILQLSSKWYDPNTLFYHKQKLMYVLKKAIERADKLGIEIQFGSPLISKLKLPDHVCDLCIKPWFYSVIMFDGTMRYCDWQVELIPKQDDFGNICQGVESIWNGSVAQQVRKNHIISGDYSTICKTCYRIGRYSDHEHGLDAYFKKWLVTGNDLKKKLFKS